VSSWQEELKQAANSIALDVLLFLVNDVPRAGYYQTFSVRTLAAQTDHSQTRVAKVVRQLERLDLIQRAGGPRPGRSLNVRLQAQASVNRFLLKGILEEGETLPVFQTPTHIQQELADLRRENQKLRTKNNRWQLGIDQLARKRIGRFYRAGFDFARIGNKAAARFEAALPTFRGQDDRSLARLLETIVEEVGRQDVDEYIQVLWGV
jgi:DNA-binding MarR family transcriptional regulator